ncbi:MAG: anthranilate synthase component 1 [Sphingomicrobium sp.]
MMRTPSLKSGEAMALYRQLSGSHDPLTLYRQLSGGRPDNLLFEAAGGVAIIMPSAAVRVTCRSGEVLVSALGEGGPNVIDALSTKLAQFVTEQSDRELRLRFARSTSSDLEERLLAPSPLDVLRALTRFPSMSPEEKFTLFCGGVVSFDHVDLFEELPQPASDPLGYPDFEFWLADALVIVESTGKARLLSTFFGSDEPDRATRAYHSAVARLDDLYEGCNQPARERRELRTEANELKPVPDLSDEDYAALVVRVKENIAAGDVYQIVPSRTFRVPCADALAAYARQRVSDPSPYMFFVSGEEHILFGASPETSVKVWRDQGASIVEVKPIAGTRRRGSTPDEDDRLEADLRLDAKEGAEHIMLVDLARNDVARVSAPGTRRVARLLTVERYARVMHMVSSVTGELAPGLDCLDALQACLNVGTLSGAPKLRATELLREYEATKRGPYGGAVGWLSGTGEMDTGVIIRSAVVKDGNAYVRAGAGVVHDSDPAAEAEETKVKASAVLAALCGD